MMTNDEREERVVLKKEADGMLKELRKLRMRIKEIDRKELLIKLRQFVGKCYRVENSYGDDTKWWLYMKILKIKPHDFLVLRCQKCSYGNIKIETKIVGVVYFDTSHMKTKLITSKEFSDQYLRLLGEVEQIRLKSEKLSG